MCSNDTFLVVGVVVCCFFNLAQQVSAQATSMESPSAPDEWRIAQVFSASSYQETSCYSQKTPGFLSYSRDPYSFDMDVIVRGYYFNDQRVQWTGNEATMGAEAILSPSLTLRQKGGGKWSAHGEFYLQNTIHKNVYIGDVGNFHGGFVLGEERASYTGNYTQNAFELSQLHVRYSSPLFDFRVGKFELPFGNYTVPLMSNSRWDAPFIRTESILWRDTGFLFRFTPSIFDACLAITNGCDGNDTNSMKAITGRLGLNFSHTTLGMSVFWQDGEGSEEQKQYRRHIGADAAIRFGNWTLSSEIIYDEYGMRRDFDPNQIFWTKSIYYRQINKAASTPISGWGGYVDLTYNHYPWFVSVNYGEYYPEQLNLPDYPQHDIINRRFLIKCGWNFTKHVQWYNALILETENYIAQCGRLRKGNALMSGIQMTF